MPLHLEPVDVSAALEDARSALIVSCPICPPVSLALQDGSPLLRPFRDGIKTSAFEDHIRGLRSQLGEQGVRTETYAMYTPCPMMCMWTPGQLRRLRKRARRHDAVIVLGCESARVTAQRALEGTGCRVVLGMELTGLTNAVVRFDAPATVGLDDRALVSDDGEVHELGP